MIRVDGLAKLFGGRVAIEGISFEVQPGEVFGLLGPNGGGKTTTMRLIAGLLKPTAGSATVAGRSLAEDGEARHLLGFLTEQPGLYERLTASENLAFFARLQGLSGEMVRVRSDEALRAVDLQDRAAEKVGTFSKGMRQRLAVVRALLHQPRAILLDEPTSGLDPEAAAGVRRIIAREATRGAAVIVSTHNLAEAERLCHRVAVVKNRLLSVVDDREARLRRVVIRARQIPDGALTVLNSLPGLRTATPTETGILLAVDGPEAVADAVAHLAGRGARIDEVVALHRPLEERYLEAVGASDVDMEGAEG
jgi:ABC-2 type transport system ATP-binding protein